MVLLLGSVLVTGQSAAGVGVFLLRAGGEPRKLILAFFPLLFQITVLLICCEWSVCLSVPVPFPASYTPN